MRKFKHKQTGKIAIQGHGGTNYAICEKPNIGIEAWLIENSNDWEEITKTEYTILSFKSNSETFLSHKEEIITKSPDKIIPFPDYYLSRLYLFSIYSVRRESEDLC